MELKKYCAVCGNEIKNKRNKQFCSYKCAGLYKQNYAKCSVCGKIFKHSPSDLTTHTCGSKECKKKFRSFRTPSQRILSAHAEIKTNPKTGHFETHHAAEEWHLISPLGEEYRFKNLALWAEQNENLLPISERTGKRVKIVTFYREIMRLKSKSEKELAYKEDYHGWRVATKGNMTE